MTPRRFEELSGSRRPSPDEFQVAVLGPGVGESIVLHVGAGRWIAVDSFMVPGGSGRVPAALHYLDSIGVDRTALVAVVVSHFDIDHVRGICQVLEAAHPEATLVLNGAASCKEFLVQLRLTDRRPDLRDKGIEELRAMWDLVRPERGSARRLERCRRDQFLLRFLERGSPPVFAYGLAPSEETITEFSQQMAPLVDGPLPTSLPHSKLNRASGALHVQVGAVAALLCGDLEEDPRRGCELRGWKGAVLPPNGARASFVKLGHHGSHNGDHEDIWTRLTTADGPTATAAFRSLKSPLPRPSDITRVAARGHSVYVAGRVDLRTTATGIRSDHEAPSPETPGPRKRRPPSPGAIVATCAADGSTPWSIESFGATFTTDGGQH